MSSGQMNVKSKKFYEIDIGRNLLIVYLNSNVIKYWKVRIYSERSTEASTKPMLLTLIITHPPAPGPKPQVSLYIVSWFHSSRN